MFRTTMIFSAVVVLLCSASGICAQEDHDALTEKFGSGVHAYYDGEYEAAHEGLTEVIDLGSSDPRCYYFRGLTYMKLGREREAIQDFTKGAELETSQLNRMYDISRALERVQGSDRLMLEKYRANARLIAYHRQKEIERQRYSYLAQQEARVLLEQSSPSGAVTELPARSVTDDAGKTGSGLIDPFGTGTTVVESTADVEPVDTTTIDMTDPFAGLDTTTDTTATTPGTAADSPAEDGQAVLGAVGNALGKAILGDAFGGSSMGGPTDVIDDEYDPFGGSMGGSADPFGEDNSTANPFGAGDNSTPVPADGGNSNPFGSDPFGAEDNSTPAPADGGNSNPFGSDPFGAENDSTPAPDDGGNSNPFGSDPFGSDPFGE